MLILTGERLTPQDIGFECYLDHQHAVIIKHKDGTEIAGLLHKENGAIIFNEKGNSGLVLCSNYLREKVASLTFIVS